MSYDDMGRGALEYFPCRYGASKTMFRGPRKRTTDDYVAFVGGADTYGRFIARPFATILEEKLGLPSVNLGCPNAGIDAFLSDEDVMAVIRGASHVVIEVTGVQNISNRFYSVHPRRNDRFLRPSELLQKLFRDVDFSQVNFTGHLLSVLQETSAEKFALVQQELQMAWVARMQALLARIDVPVTLLWFGPEAPAQDGIVTRAMLDQLTGKGVELVTCVPSRQALAEGTDGMIFRAEEAAIAASQLSSAAHWEAAQALLPVVNAAVFPAKVQALIA